MRSRAYKKNSNSDSSTALPGFVASGESFNLSLFSALGFEVSLDRSGAREGRTHFPARGIEGTQGSGGAGRGPGTDNTSAQ